MCYNETISLATHMVSKNSNNNIDFSVKVAGAAVKYTPATDENLISQKILILLEQGNTQSVNLVANISRVLTYMKKEFVIKDIKKDTFKYDDYWLVIITSHDISIIPDIDVITKYVSYGGNVFFSVNQDVSESYYRIYRKLGIQEFGNQKIFSGIVLSDNILIKGTGLSVRGELIDNFGLKVSLNNNCRVHVVSKDQNPIIWDVDYGKGKFMVNNGTMLAGRNNRGLVAGCISMISDGYIYPVMNIKLVYIDDFPAPFPNGYNQKITKEYSRNIEGFFRDIWWPDMLKSSFLYNLKYTGMIIETYNNNVSIPFGGTKSGEKKNLILYGRELINSGGELGVHGYNHQPLAENGYIKNDVGYKPWENASDMKASLKEFNLFTRSIFPYYKFMVYVPPSNILSPLGRQSLLEEIPTIRVISSVYYKEDDDDQYVQEFEVNKDGIIEMPRISSGYNNSEESLWNEYNSITSLGIFSHFIHPDDVLDSHRNGDSSWKTLYTEYNKLMSNINKNFNWLRPVTASAGAYEIKKSVEAKFDFYRKPGGMIGYCDKIGSSGNFILRSTKKVNPVLNCTVSMIDTGIYLITVSKSVFEINFTERR